MRSGSLQGERVGPGLPAVYAFGFLALYLLLLLFPLYWLVVTSLKEANEFLTGGGQDFLPRDPQFTAYEVVWFLRPAFYDSLIVSIPAAVVATVVGAMAGYSIAHVRRGAGAILIAFLAIRILPPISIILPIFLLADDLGLRDTHFELILIYAVFALPFTVLITFALFRQIPQELEEAALVDGSTRSQVARYISIPLMKPGLVAAFVFAFVFAWTDFIFAILLTGDAVATIPIEIGNLTRGAMGPGALSPLISALSIAAGVVPAAIVSVLVYLILRRRVTIDSLGA